MSPKSLLRHPGCVSNFEDFVTDTRFLEVIDDPAFAKRKSATVKRLILCTGKIYYDLEAEKQVQKIKEIVIIRIEQLYPFPEKQIRALLKKYKTDEIYWVQEEPENMGAWIYVLSKMRDVPLNVISRKGSASPATGFKKIHDKMQKEIIQKALEL